jgi:hypothetical protein
MVPVRHAQVQILASPLAPATLLLTRRNQESIPCINLSPTIPVSGGRFRYVKGGGSYVGAGLFEATFIGTKTSQCHFWEEGKTHCKNHRELHVGD